jgi:oligopeptide transport system substrate-binding protein
MAQTKRAHGLWAALAASLFAAACGGGSDETRPGGTPAFERGVLYRGNGAEPKSLDPHQASGTWEDAIIGDLIVGLVTDDAAGEPIPGAAERWETSADGLTWRFHLRDHVWSDGTPVTAEDFVYAWRRILDPKTAAAYASILYVFKNARPINRGEMPAEMLGARAVDARTLELDLENPAPYLPELMTHFTTYPLPRHVVEAHGDAWTRAGTYIGNGPYSLVEWVPNDHITTQKNPRFYDAASVSVERVVFFPSTDSEAALRRFRAGELDVQDPLPASQIDWLRENMPEVVQIGPYLGLGYLVTNQTRPPFDDVRVRKALALTYDRETITGKIVRMGAPPAYTIVPPGVANYPGGNAFDFKDLPQAERVAQAQALMRQAGFGPEKRLATTLSTSTSPDARRVAAAVQQMWREIYVDIEIVQSEVQVNYLKLQEADFDIGGAGWVADFNDARNFLFLLMTDNDGQNYGRYSNPKFDALMAQADQEQDAARRGQLMAQAEAIALEEVAWIPTLYLVTSNLVRPYVKGWVANIGDQHRTRWLSIDEDARAALFR